MIMKKRTHEEKGGDKDEDLVALIEVFLASPLRFLLRFHILSHQFLHQFQLINLKLEV